MMHEASWQRPTVRRLGVYIDAEYTRHDGADILTGPVTYPFLRFACEVGTHFDGVSLFGRAGRSLPDAVHRLPSGTGLIELPHYGSLRDLGAVLRASVSTVRAMWRGLDRVDVVWIFGPHPFALVLVALASARRRRVVLGVRQDTIRYFRARLPNAAWRPAMLPVRAMDMAFRLIARRVDTTVVGGAIERAYDGPRRGLLPMVVSLVREADLAAAPRSGCLSNPVRLLTVGRVAREKSPDVLLRALSLLRSANVRFRLTWIGDGPLLEKTVAAARVAGMSDAIDFRGFVPFGPGLLDEYRRADIFVHSARTEGVPQVIVEAMASGLPIVATDVGGVRSALDDGRAGLLVASEHAQELAQALRRMIGDAGLRHQVASAGLRAAADVTREREARRVADFIAGGVA